MDDNLAATGPTRRDLLRGAGLGGLALGAVALGLPLLSACSSSSNGSHASTGQTTTSGAASTPTASFDLRLGWVPDAEFSGYFAADASGAYGQHGLQVGFLPGGPTSAVEPVVTSGKALIGIDPIPENVAAATAQGANLTIIGAQFQKSADCWVSLAAKPITQPSDIEGKRLGISLTGKSEALVFMRLNGVDSSKVDLVPVQNDPAPLVAGEIDALWGLATNQPIVLAARGVQSHTMLLADYHFNRMQDVLMVTKDTLNDPTKKQQVRNFLLASQQGWAKVLADPSYAAQLVVGKYGKNLGLTAVSQENTVKAMAPFIMPSGVATSGILTMSDALITQTIATLNSMGVKADKSLFTTDLL